MVVNMLFVGANTAPCERASPGALSREGGGGGGRNIRLLSLSKSLTGRLFRNSWMRSFPLSRQCLASADSFQLASKMRAVPGRRIEGMQVG